MAFIYYDSQHDGWNEYSKTLLKDDYNIKLTTIYPTASGITHSVLVYYEYNNGILNYKTSEFKGWTDTTFNVII